MQHATAFRAGIVFLFPILFLTNRSVCMAQSDTLESEPIVVTALRRPEALRNSLQEIRLLDAQKLALYQASTTADALQQAGMVFVQKSQQGGGSPVLRGFEANRICLVVDGIKLNNAIFRGGHLQNIISLDNFSLEGIEVLHGPASVMYGSDALGGVVHLRTRKPAFDSAGRSRVQAQYRFGSANAEHTAHADYEVSRKNLALYGSFTYSHFGDLVMGRRVLPGSSDFGQRPIYAKRINGIDSIVRNSNPYRQPGSGYQQWDAVQKIRHRLSKDLVQELNLQLSNTSNVPRTDRLSEVKAGKPVFSDWYYGPQKRMLASYLLQHNWDEPKSGLAYQLGLSQQALEESRHTRSFGAANRSSRIEKIQISGLTADFRLPMGSHTLQFGGDAQVNYLKSTAFRTHVTTGAQSPQSTRYPDGRNQMVAAGLYASHSWQVGTRWKMQEGVRIGLSDLHSQFTDTSFFPFPYSEVRQRNGVYSGNLGIQYQARNENRLGLLLASGFRSPNIDDLAKVFDSSPGNLIVPNPDLKPEKTLTLELNGHIKLYKKLYWQQVVYQTWLFDAIVTDSFQFQGSRIWMYDGRLSQVMANQNQQRAFIQGFTSQLAWDFWPGWKLESGLTYTYGRIREGSGTTPLDHISPLLGRASVQYSGKKWNAVLFLVWNGRKSIADYKLNGEDNEAYAPAAGMPAWHTWNLRSSYQIHTHLMLFAGVENILDAQYRTFSSGLNGAGRNVSLSLRASF